MTGQHTDNRIRWTPVLVTLIICATLLLMAALGGCGKTATAPLKPSATVTLKATPTAAIPTAPPAASGKGAFLTAATILKAAIPSTPILAETCTTLGGDVDLAVNLGPYPDSSIQQQWSKALTDLKSAATECVAGISNNDPSLQSKAAADLSAAQGELETAMTAMQQH